MSKEKSLQSLPKQENLELLSRMASVCTLFFVVVFHFVSLQVQRLRPGNFAFYQTTAPIPKSFGILIPDSVFPFPTP